MHFGANLYKSFSKFVTILPNNGIQVHSFFTRIISLLFELVGLQNIPIRNNAFYIRVYNELTLPWLINLYKYTILSALI